MDPGQVESQEERNEHWAPAERMRGPGKDPKLVTRKSQCLSGSGQNPLKEMIVWNV